MRASKLSHRPRLDFSPRWHGPISAHAANVIRRSWGILSQWYEWEDLTHEAYVVFLRCVKQYPQVDNPAWFMSIFRTSWRNRMADILWQLPRYSLVGEQLPEPLHPVADLDVAVDLCAGLHALPLELRATLHDLCRSKQRLDHSEGDIERLWEAMTKL